MAWPKDNHLRHSKFIALTSTNAAGCPASAAAGRTIWRISGPGHSVLLDRCCAARRSLSVRSGSMSTIGFDCRY